MQSNTAEYLSEALSNGKVFFYLKNSLSMVKEPYIKIAQFYQENFSKIIESCSRCLQLLKMADMIWP